MFKYTIDTKPEIIDNNNNKIIDFLSPLFNKNSTGVQDYIVKRVNSEKYVMRPDLISFAMYGDIEMAEYILKFAGISNPFTLCEDDVLKIPNDTEAYGMMAANNPLNNTDNSNNRETSIRNQFKFYDPSLNRYSNNGESYRELQNKKIPTGIIKPSDPNKVMVPYISEDGRTAVTIRNGKVYFGGNAGPATAGVNTSPINNMYSSLQTAINNTNTELSDSNCIYNGVNLSDFIRANFNK